jgi:hypothetical protein
MGGEKAKVIWLRRTGGGLGIWEEEEEEDEEKELGG